MMRTLIHDRVEMCRAGTHPGLVARMPSGWAVLGDSQLLRGYCLLLPDPIAPTLNDLEPAHREAFLRDMAALGDAVIAVCRPVRINYEMLGNLEPALHAHVIPRYADEAEAMRTRSVFLYPPEVWNDPRRALAAGGHDELRRAIATALAAPSVAIDTDDSGLLRAACALAAFKHRHQVRRDGRTPYFSHCARVALVVSREFGCRDGACLAAALLHDVIEDTTTDFDDLCDALPGEAGVEAARTIAALTKDARLPEAERERQYDAQLAGAGWRARLIKLADAYDNLCDRTESGTGPALDRVIERARRALALAARDEHPACFARARQVLERAIRRAEAGSVV